MIPRTVQMAAEVAATFTPTQLDDYGNIILNGYLESVPNTINKKAWQYRETVTAPVNLPSLTQITPALRGWTTNYQEYYTQLPVNGYGQVPGNPTMFEYSVHNYSATGQPLWAQAPPPLLPKPGWRHWAQPLDQLPGRHPVLVHLPSRRQPGGTTR